MNKEGEPKLGVSRMALGYVPDRTAFRNLSKINRQLDQRFALEVVPHRLVTARGYEELCKNFGIKIVGVHGPLQPYPENLLRIAKENLTIKKPKNPREAILDLVWLIGFGALQEPEWAKRYGSYLDLAQKLNAYLVMHKEPLEAITDELNRAWAAKVKLLRENGWGPPDGLFDPLSWKPQTIKKDADKHQMGTVLDTSAAARAGVDIIQAFEVMQPQAIHLSDHKITVDGYHLENLIPGTGNQGPKLKEIYQEVKKRNGVFVVFEIRARNLFAALDDTLNYLEGGSPGSSRGI